MWEGEKKKKFEETVEEIINLDNNNGFPHTHIHTHSHTKQTHTHT